MTECCNYSLTITKEQLAELPKVSYPGVIKVVNTAAEMRRAIEILKNYSILGFDTESRPTFRKGATIHVSLMQIAAEDVCFLFRIKKINDISSLSAIIESEKILKVGLSIHDDFNILSHDYNFAPKGFVDLQKIVPSYKFASLSLQKIYAILFNERITKSQQLSNWDATELSDAQISYAAIDAWACIKIYNRLIIEKFNPENSDYKIYQ